jgi:methyl-accepting chemotaxis protein
MNTVAVATTELSAAASEIARSAGDASRTAETAVRAADHANQLMERLADSSARIGEVVESIRGIAAQTTMLALNATIEAARAGEAGRGFAVVASEVKDLAAETGTATADIVGRVDAIHADTQAALVALGEVAQVITEISSSQSVIAAAVEEQAATTAEIDRSLTEAVTAVNQLAGHTDTTHTGTHITRRTTSPAPPDALSVIRKPPDQGSIKLTPAVKTLAPALRTSRSSARSLDVPTHSNSVGETDMNSILKNIRVAVRLPFVSILALAGLVVFAVTALTTLNTVKIGSDKEQAIAEQNVLLADILPPPAFLVETQLRVLELREAFRLGDTAAMTEARDTIDVLADQFRDRQDHWQTALVDGSPEKASMADARTAGFAYLDIVETRLLPAIDTADTTAVDAAAAELVAFEDAHRTAIDATATTVTDNTAIMTTTAVDLANGRQTMLWTLLGLTLVIVGAAAFTVTRSVLRPLDELRRNMDDIASGDTATADVRLDADRRDEFGQVADSFNTFADKLVTTTREVETNARNAESRAVEVSAAATVAAENMNTVAVATTELSAAASEIARSAGDASRTAETAVRAADHANQLMERLADSSARIGEVVESIRGIAAQTTMLALNATIEAARAGEAGRGFAVVASEVKDLAAETGTATADIVGRVDAIHADTQAALVALGEVAQVITEISSSQSVIAAAVEEQAATTAEIDRSLTEAVTAVNQLAARTDSNEYDVADGHYSDDHFTSAA